MEFPQITFYSYFSNEIKAEKLYLIWQVFKASLHFKLEFKIVNIVLGKWIFFPYRIMFKIVEPSYIFFSVITR